VRGGPVGQDVPQIYRILKCIVDSFGLDCFLLTEGSILTGLRVTSISELQKSTNGDLRHWLKFNINVETKRSFTFDERNSGLTIDKITQKNFNFLFT
jgi:hypothetical protein